MHPIISKSQARASGLRRYYTGVPCKNGHLAERSLNGNCLECRNEYEREYRSRPETRKLVRATNKRRYDRHPAIGNYLSNYQRKRLYGITPDQFQSMFEHQWGYCAICREPMTQPCVDHCHITNTVRGLLCRGCNTGLGLFKDRPELCHAAQQYLLHHQFIRAQTVRSVGNV